MLCGAGLRLLDSLHIGSTYRLDVIWALGDTLISRAASFGGPIETMYGIFCLNPLT